MRYASEIVRNARRVRWLLSSLARESLTNARFLFLSLSLRSSVLLLYRSRGILFYGDLQGGTCRGTASGTHRGRTVPPFFRTKRTVSQPDATQLAA